MTKIYDSVKQPEHYVYKGIECKDIAGMFNYFRGCAIKYIWRAGKKNADTEIEDLQKAIQYLLFEIERLKGESHD